MWSREEGGRLLIFNSYTAGFMQFEGALAGLVLEILTGSVEAGGAFAEYLASQGLLVPSDVDEMALARGLHEAPFQGDERLGLTLLSHENCNYRCVYCYEEFKKN